MKADMRVPASGGTEYLLVIEAETDLERGALAHFVRATPVGYPETAPDAAQELRVVFAVPHRDPGNTGARSIAAAFIGWDKRASEQMCRGETDGIGCTESALAGGEYCAFHQAKRGSVGCPNTRHKMSEFCDAHARAQPAYELDGPAKARAEHERIMAQLTDWAKRNTLSWASKPESRDLYNMLCDALTALKELGNG